MNEARWQVQYTWTETGPNGYEEAEYCLLHLVLDGKAIDRRIDYRYAKRGQREWQTL